MKTTSLKTHLGLHFTDESGVKHTSWQLLDANNYSVADAYFVGATVKRFMFADSVREEALDWFKGLETRIESL